MMSDDSEVHYALGADDILIRGERSPTIVGDWTNKNEAKDVEALVRFDVAFSALSELEARRVIEFLYHKYGPPHARRG
jgi:hypothetical protein